MRIKDSHMKKLQKETPKSKKHKILKATKIVLYAVMWLIAWSAIAFGMAVVLIMSVVFSIAPDGVMTPREANNSVLAVILIIGALFLGTVWLMRKAKSLSYRTSRYVLLVCTVTGLLVGIPMSLLGVWQPDVDSSNSAATIDEKKPELKRYQYMLCSDGSYRMYTDEQMKTPGVGFTDESQDSCEENEQGKMLQLTNSLEEAKANSKKQSTYTPIPTETCTEIDIPFKTIREPVDWLYVGEEKEAYTGGIDGSRKVCKDSSGNVTRDYVQYEPYNQTIFYGTAEKPTSTGGSSQSNVDLNALCAHTPANSTYRADCIERYRRQYYGN